MADLYLQKINGIVMELEDILDLDVIIEGIGEGEQIIGELPIKDCLSAVLDYFSEELTVDQRRDIRSRAIQASELLPSIALQLQFKDLHKLDMSYMPLTSTVSEILVNLTDKDKVSSKNIGDLNVLILMLEQTEMHNEECFRLLEYRLFRMTLLLASISCYIGSCFLADFLLRQMIINEE